tara:strand:- start:673 stop:846 length:174 start_codon:yes stop_codon:yes gene_type:complete
MDEESIGILIVAIAVSLCLAFFGGWKLGISQTQEKAAQTECARYHPDTGKFEWLRQD